MLRMPVQRVGTHPNADLPPPSRDGLALVKSPPARVDAPSESLLRDALIGRDAEAFRIVVQRMWPEMIRIATAHVRSADDAQDVVQDSWLAALGSIDRFKGHASLRTWLLRILAYRARTAGARAARSIPMSQVIDPDASATATSSAMERAENAMFTRAPSTPEEITTRAELGQVLNDAIAILPDRQREVLILHDVEGRSRQDVCMRLKLSPGNQRVLLHRARMRVRDYVAERWLRD